MKTTSPTEEPFIPIDLPLNIVPLDKENPTNGSIIIPKIVDGKVTNEKVTIVGPNIIFKTLYEDFIKEKFSKIDKSKWKKLKNKELAAYNAIQKDVQTGPLANEFKTYIALNWEEKEITEMKQGLAT